MRYSGIDRIPDLLMPGLQKYNANLYLGWREICHISSSLLLLIAAHSASFFTYIDLPLLIFLVLLVWMTFQEFYLHPKKYGQKLGKGILDWSMWILPFALYFLFR